MSRGVSLLAVIGTAAALYFGDSQLREGFQEVKDQHAYHHARDAFLGAYGDVNGDGRVSQEEAATLLRETFEHHGLLYHQGMVFQRNGERVPYTTLTTLLSSNNLIKK